MKNPMQQKTYAEALKQMAKTLADIEQMEGLLDKADPHDRERHAQIKNACDYARNELWHTKLFVATLFDRSFSDVEVDIEVLYDSCYREQRGIDEH